MRKIKINLKLEKKEGNNDHEITQIGQSKTIKVLYAPREAEPNQLGIIVTRNQVERLGGFPGKEKLVLRDLLQQISSMHHKI